MCRDCTVVLTSLYPARRDFQWRRGIERVLAERADETDDTPEIFVLGEQVEARCNNWKHFYEGIVTAIDPSGRSCEVTFDDGEVVSGVTVSHLRQHSKESVREIPTKPDQVCHVFFGCTVPTPT